MTKETKVKLSINNLLFCASMCNGLKLCCPKICCQFESTTVCVTTPFATKHTNTKGVHVCAKPQIM